MPHRKLVEEYYTDINNVADLLNKLVNSYRLLIGGAGELNTIALAHKKDVKHALKRVNELGDVIDDLIDVLDKSSYIYMDYCKIKSQIMEYQIQAQYIQTEIDNELELKNDKKEHDKKE
jgi:hypothetical protein